MNRKRKWIMYLGGLLTLSFGVVLMIQARIGIAPWDALNVALEKHLGMSIGFWVFAVGSILIIINGFIKQGMPDLLGFIPIIIIGLLIDGINFLFADGMDSNNKITGWFLFITGLLVLSCGIAFYIRSSLPAVPNDEFMIELSKRTGWSLALTKTCGEGLAFLIAFLLNGPIGIGTLVVVCLLGVLINVASRFFDMIKIPKY